MDRPSVRPATDVSLIHGSVTVITTVAITQTKAEAYAVSPVITAKPLILLSVYYMYMYIHSLSLNTTPTFTLMNMSLSITESNLFRTIFFCSHISKRRSILFYHDSETANIIPNSIVYYATHLNGSH